MEVYTLVGKSGSGKSFNAMEVCRAHGIDAIIDDGFLIYQNRIAAGVSAKKARTKIGAVKVALFLDEEQRDAVKAELEKRSPSAILVLGTSDGMVDRILERLGLPVPPLDSPNRIKIEDITTPEERERAHQQRDELGKHVIPAPSMALKRSFAGYFMDPLRFIRGKDEGAAAERTVVRPTYSYMGDYILAERVIDDIISCVCQQHPAASRVVYVGHSTSPESYELMVVLRLKHGYSLWEAASELQEQVAAMVEQMTAFNVSRVDVEVRGID